jgi:hypothetical protein
MISAVQVRISATILVGATYAQKTVEIRHKLRPAVATAWTMIATGTSTAMMTTAPLMLTAFVIITVSAKKTKTATIARATA